MTDDPNHQDDRAPATGPHRLVAIDVEVERREPPADAAAGPVLEPMSDTERHFRRFWRFGAVALVPLIGALIATANYLVDRTSKDERAAIEREQLILHDADHDRRLRMLEDVVNRTIQRVDDMAHGRDRDWDITPAPLRSPAPRTTP